jgi:hypothetical protein
MTTRRIETRELIATVRRVAREQPSYRPETILYLNLAACELERLAYRHKITCKLFSDPFDERDAVGPCTCEGSMKSDAGGKHD